VNVRNTNESFQTRLITAKTSDTFTVSCADSGSTSGSEGAYSPGFRFEHSTSTAVTAGTLTFPGDSAELALLSIRAHFPGGSRGGQTYGVTLPKQTGLNASIDDFSVPALMVRNANSGLNAVGSTMGVTFNATDCLLSVGALPITSATAYLILTFA
jgi:hypothetical protein